MSPILFGVDGGLRCEALVGMEQPSFLEEANQGKMRSSLEEGKY